MRGREIRDTAAAEATTRNRFSEPVLERRSTSAVPTLGCRGTATCNMPRLTRVALARGGAVAVRRCSSTEGTTARRCGALAASGASIHPSSPSDRPEARASAESVCSRSRRVRAAAFLRSDRKGEIGRTTRGPTRRWSARSPDRSQPPDRPRRRSQRSPPSMLHSRTSNVAFRPAVSRSGCRGSRARESSVRSAPRARRAAQRFGQAAEAGKLHA